MSLESTITMSQRNGWDPANTRIFDVYIQDGSASEPGPHQLEDVFAYSTAGATVVSSVATTSPESASASASTSTSESDVGSDMDDASLVNTGAGRRVSLSPASLAHRYVPRPHVKPPRLDLNSSGGPAHGPGASQAQMQGQGPGKAQALSMHMNARAALPLSMQRRPEALTHTAPVPYGSAPSSAPAGMHALANTDIWSSPVENAFLAALRIIMKNGTSKIKLRDRNYGRNELISLFIRHNVGEHRTKKQISSHIQVWKKSIVSKLQNNLELSPYERELLELIENGARQTQENKILFNKVFCEILDATDASSVRGGGGGAGRVVTNPPVAPAAPTAVPVPAAADYTAMEHAIEPPMDHNMHHAGRPLVSAPARFSDSAVEVVREPQTPLEYAKRVYSNLRSYKCVPVNMQEYAPHHQAPTPVSALAEPVDMSVGALPTSTPDSGALQAAKEVEMQQRRLIQSLYATPGSSDVHRSFVGGDPTGSDARQVPHHQQMHTPYLMPAQSYSSSSETFTGE
ncbi:LAFE_0G15918g1_1 [Lachancea fermentati]|uniref:LAFE_0G15918g1_1 n=1 Tax=Lachancea fermentati TaxID=4955 RepID=A0A1G4MIL7_LACFM|nr:LAFE_0G15918g1_1 [Lachancea fermentati]